MRITAEHNVYVSAINSSMAALRSEEFAILVYAHLNRTRERPVARPVGLGCYDKHIIRSDTSERRSQTEELRHMPELGV